MLICSSSMLTIMGEWRLGVWGAGVLGRERVRWTGAD